MPEASAKISWSTRTLKRNSDTKGLSSFSLIAVLKELGLMKCVLKYGGGGIGGGASKAGGASFGMVLADDEGAGISVGETTSGISIC